ncbi:unnamed protein product [Ranitomeya imitator]|uniref:Cell cycle checkpoint control protein RAD9A n=1 Tax=Ranitomeya imitator TaxID=111125 RepID=A0ABN9L5L0_9NEOB|nr:unnamed protein product [Ranitomeya imitator]
MKQMEELWMLWPMIWQCQSFQVCMKAQFATVLCTSEKKNPTEQRPDGVQSNSAASLYSTLSLQRYSIGFRLGSGRAIHSLSRIGEELYLEPLDDGLCLRSVNSSRSAYACFKLAPLFFYAYEATGGGCHCKIYMKSVMSVFRSLPSLEKTVEKCVIKLNTDSSRLVIQLFCKYGVTKTHNLSYQDCESLQAVYNPDSCPNVLRAHARLLSDAVVHFPLTLAEVTLGASPCGKVTLRNYVEEEIDPSKAMLTELSLSREEFLAYQLQEQREITFCLREFRGLLAFAESSSLPISIQFDSAGCPVIFSVDDAVLEAHFVLATLSDAGQASQSQNHRYFIYTIGGTSQISDLTVCTALCQITDLTCSAAGFTVPALSRLCEATSLPAGPGSAAILDPGLEGAGREVRPSQQRDHIALLRGSQGSPQGAPSLRGASLHRRHIAIIFDRGVPGVNVPGAVRDRSWHIVPDVSCDKQLTPGRDRPRSPRERGRSAMTYYPVQGQISPGHLDGIVRLRSQRG